MDLPAPVSPVSAPRLLSWGPPAASRANVRSSFSIRTKSRIESDCSMALFGVDPEILAGENQVAVGIPVSAREVVAEHGGGLLGLALDAQRHVALDQPMQRLRYVGSRLVALDHHAVAVDRADVLLLLLIVAADVHLLAGEMVDGEFDLEARVARIWRVGEALDDLGQRIERLLRNALVAADVGDLLVETERLQVVGVRDILVAGMELDEAVDRDQ